MKKLLLLFSFSVFTGYSQDTIFFRGKDPMVVKILEVGLESVRYVRWDYIDGPSYDCHKNEVKSIHFSSGHKENYVVKNYVRGPAPPARPEKITLVKNKIFYQGKRISDGQLYYLVSNVNVPPEYQKQVSDVCAEMRILQSKQRFLLYFGVFSFAAGPLVGAFTKELYKEPFLVPAFSSAGGMVFITTLFMYDEIRTKRRDGRIALVNFYNEFR